MLERFKAAFLSHRQNQQRFLKFQQDFDEKHLALLGKIALLSDLDHPDTDDLEATRASLKNRADLAPMLAGMSERVASMEELVDAVEKANREASEAIRSFPSDDGFEAALKGVCTTAEGRAALDEMVAALGEKVSKGGDRAFLALALKARFEIDALEGHLSKKGLPQLYRVLRMVPESHVRDNDRLKVIKRFKQQTEDDDSKKRSVSFYKLENDVGRIVLNVGPVKKTEYYYPGGEKTEVNTFTVTTLHEIGHAVDEKLHFMRDREEDPDYGDWKSLEFKDIEQILDDTLGFAADYPDIPPKMRRSIYQSVVNGKKERPPSWEGLVGALAGLTPEGLLADAGLQRAEALREEFEEDGWPELRELNASKSECKQLANQDPIFRIVALNDLLEQIFDRQVPLTDAVAAYLPRAVTAEDLEWNPAILEHEALRWLAAVSQGGSEDSGLWGQGDGAARYAIDGRVYQQCYTTRWASYAVDARAHGVCDYQFRHMGEWFAELYAMYHMGLLPDDHPANAWLETL